MGGYFFTFLFVIFYTLPGNIPKFCCFLQYTMYFFIYAYLVSVIFTFNNVKNSDFSSLVTWFSVKNRRILHYVLYKINKIGVFCCGRSCDPAAVSRFRQRWRFCEMLKLFIIVSWDCFHNAFSSLFIVKRLKRIIWREYDVCFITVTIPILCEKDSGRR